VIFPTGIIRHPRSTEPCPASRVRPQRRSSRLLRDLRIDRRLGTPRGLPPSRAVAQGMIQDDSRRSVVFYDNEGLAWARDRTVRTRAPAFVKAFAMSSAIRDSSSQMRIEQPARLALLMLCLVARQSAKCQRQGRRSRHCERLKGRNIPYVLHSGYTARQVYVPKRASPQLLVTAVEGLLCDRQIAN
jgi:hypothetical protein